MISQVYLQDDELKARVVDWSGCEPTADEPYDEYWVDDYIHHHAGSIERRVDTETGVWVKPTDGIIREAVLETSGDIDAAVQYVVNWIYS